MPILGFKRPTKKPAASRPSRSASKQPGQAAPSPARQAGSGRTAPLLGTISPGRKMDILGVALALVGLLTTLSFFSARNGGLSGGWISFLATVFGWGRFILPLA